MRDNGAIEGGAAGFSVGDEVVVVKKFDNQKTYVVSHADGIRSCFQNLLLRFAAGSGTATRVQIVSLGETAYQILYDQEVEIGTPEWVGWDNSAQCPVGVWYNSGTYYRCLKDSASEELFSIADIPGYSKNSVAINGYYTPDGSYALSFFFSYTASSVFGISYGSLYNRIIENEEWTDTTVIANSVITTSDMQWRSAIDWKESGQWVHAGARYIVHAVPDIHFTGIFDVKRVDGYTEHLLSDYPVVYARISGVTPMDGILYSLAQTVYYGDVILGTGEGAIPFVSGIFIDSQGMFVGRGAEGISVPNSVYDLNFNILYTLPEAVWTRGQGIIASVP